MVRSVPVRRLVRLGMLLTLLVATANPASAETPGTDVLVTRDLTYGSDEGQPLRLDVYQPTLDTSLHPIMILVHGGGWVSGDKAEYEPFSRSLAREGFLVFDINYSLDVSRSPAYPREVSDVEAAFAWVHAHAGQFDGDTHRIVVAGGSAGGYLAAMLGTAPTKPNTAPIRAVISLSGPMDLVALVGSLRQAVTTAPTQCPDAKCASLDLARVRLRGLLGCDPLKCSTGLLRAASPITHVTASTPAFFVANSTREIIPASQATNMAGVLRAQHVPVELHLVPGSGHAVAYVPAIAAPLLAFVTKYDNASAPSAPTSATPTAQQGQPRGLFRPRNIAASILFLLVLIYTARRLTSRVVDGRSGARAVRPPDERISGG